MEPATDEELQELYEWVDEIPLSRPKRNIARDFSDAVLLAEVIAHYQPRLVQLHNYSSANSLSQKAYNWKTINSKVLRRLGFSLAQDDIDKLINCTPGAVEALLKMTKKKLADFCATAPREHSKNSRNSSRAAANVSYGEQKVMRARQPLANHDGNAHTADSTGAASRMDSPSISDTPPPASVAAPSNPDHPPPPSSMRQPQRAHPPSSQPQPPQQQQQQQQHQKPAHIIEQSQPTQRSGIEAEQQRENCHPQNRHELKQQQQQQRHVNHVQHAQEQWHQQQRRQQNEKRQEHAVFRPSVGAGNARAVGMPHANGLPSNLHRIIAAEEMRDSVRDELLVDKEATIMEMRETMNILEKKIRKLEQLVKIKDAKIQALSSKMRAAGVE